VLVATLSPLAERVLEQQLVPALVPILRAHLLRLPTLRERGEDLRGLVLDRLLRSGVRRQGQPLGIEPQALALLLSYAWPGNDAELRGLVERAALLATRERVSLADLLAAGFVEAPEAELEQSAGAEPAPRAAPSRSQRMRKMDARPAATTDAPASDAPASDAPASDAPASDAPVSQAASPLESEAPARRAESAASGEIATAPRSSPRRRRRR
jgi:DNA-binding NtrC family response regulator